MIISIIIFVVAFILVAFLASFFLNYYKMKKTPVVEDNGKIKKLSDQNFEHQIKSGIVLVDFWAPWCGPCRLVAPILEELATEHAGKVSVVKLNTDENPEITARYGITGIPTMNVYVKGQVVKTLVGALPKPKLVRELADYLN